MNAPISILEALVQRAGQPLKHGRGDMAHAWSEACRGSQEPPAESWWRCLVDAGQSLGLRLRPADLTAEELLSAATHGACAVVWQPDHELQDGRCLLVSEARGRSVQVQDGNQRESRQSIKELITGLGVAAPVSRVRCVLLTPEQLMGETKSQDPVRRLWRLLQPERGDLWVVFVFALFVGVLTLASPIAVEALVNTVAFGRLLQPVFVLSLLLFTFLAFGAALRAAQIYVVEILQRRLFVRLASDLAIRLPRVREQAWEGGNPPEMVNRFLEVSAVQKATAQLLLDGVQIVLGTLVGMALLAVYHPWLLGFDLFLLLLFATIVFLLGRGAVATSIKESKYKYQLMGWLEELARCRNAFRLPGGAHLAAEHADHLIIHYLEARQMHFRILWKQILFALAVQAVASTVLLGLGGWLVISGQLTLGQLVAAELIVAVIVGSFAKLGKHFESFYDLTASIDKLGLLLDLPLERQAGVLPAASARGMEVRLHNVSCHGPSQRARLHRLTLHVAAGERVALLENGDGESGLLLDLLFGLREPDEGFVQLDDLRASELRPDRWRSQALLLRSAEVFEGTIADNLGLHQPQYGRSELVAALRGVGLADAVAALPAGLDTPLSVDGGPLSPSQTRLLMLARAVLLKPRLVMIDGLLDALPDSLIGPAMSGLFESLPQATILVGSGRRCVISRCQRSVQMHSHTVPASNAKPHTSALTPVVAE